jgi:hypothetical protein
VSYISFLNVFPSPVSLQQNFCSSINVSVWGIKIQIKDFPIEILHSFAKKKKKKKVMNERGKMICKSGNIRIFCVKGIVPNR